MGVLSLFNVILFFIFYKSHSVYECMYSDKYVEDEINSEIKKLFDFVSEINDINDFSIILSETKKNKYGIMWLDANLKSNDFLYTAIRASNLNINELRLKDEIKVLLNHPILWWFDTDTNQIFLKIITHKERSKSSLYVSLENLYFSSTDFASVLLQQYISEQTFIVPKQLFLDYFEINSKNNDKLYKWIEKTKELDNVLNTVVNSYKEYANNIIKINEIKDDIYYMGSESRIIQINYKFDFNKYKCQGCINFSKKSVNIDLFKPQITGDVLKNLKKCDIF